MKKLLLLTITGLFLIYTAGMFLDAKPGKKITDKESDMNHADHNSGVFLLKYPIYPTPDPNRITSAWRRFFAW